MNRDEFNPYDWIPKKEAYKPRKSIKRNYARNSHNRVEVITERIENKQIDLTANYRDWLKIGFALCAEFGEEGRDYYHRISRFHENYDFNECNKQYSKCLRSQGSGQITIGTFFFMAKNAGVSIRV